MVHDSSNVELEVFGLQWNSSGMSFTHLQGTHVGCPSAGGNKSTVRPPHAPVF